MLKKLQALAERGVGGEKETAKKKLAQLMEKYNIEETDLDEEKMEVHDFRYHNEFERRILRQLFYKIVPDFRKHTYTYRYGKGSRSICGIRCTKAQALQIQIEYDFYCGLWGEEVWFFLEAFIQKHRIFAQVKEENRNGDEMTLKDAIRMAAMMDGMQDREIIPMIEEES